MPNPLDFDPTSPLFQQDPYSFYARLRSEDPVHWNDQLKVWLVSRRADVTVVLRDPRWSCDSAVLQRDKATSVAANSAMGHILLFMDVPEHSRLRTIVSRHINALVSEVVEYGSVVANKMVESLRSRDEIDLVSEFAAKFSVLLLARLLGIPEGDLPIISGSIQELAWLTDWTPNPEVLEAVQRRGLELTPYLFRLVEQKRRNPGRDLLSALAVEAKQRNIRYIDVVSTGILLLAAGQATSTHMLGNGMSALCRRHSMLEECRAGAHPVHRILDEMLRFDAPVQMTPRTALVDMKLGDRMIQRGQVVLALLGSANHDGSVMAQPDSFHPGRPMASSMTFGSGPHYCVGAELARFAGATALRSLLACPRLELSDQPMEWKAAFTQRGLKSLRISL